MGKLGEILSHPDELLPLVRMARAAHRAAKLPSDQNLAFCYKMLNNVSRSFAIVIQQLPNPLRDAICVFYLVLRGLDTVEDDMALDVGFKVDRLRTFHEKIYVRNFTMFCGSNHYQLLMVEFNRVIGAFLNLDLVYQKVIADITRRMGYGMAEFIEKEVMTVKDYDLYCHYVAGLVGIGLSQLFGACGLESPRLSEEEDLANHMGLFLQKTNIIRDYLEDIMELPAPRMFWPREIWGRYAASLEEFKLPANRKQAVQCLNHLVVDALRHLPYCLQYMQQLQHVMVFRFCAIPQIMAAGTLALCYNNGNVFSGVVKMRRGQTAKVFQTCSNPGDLYRWLIHFLNVMDQKAAREVAADDPTLAIMRQHVKDNLTCCREKLAAWEMAQPCSVLAVLRDFTLVMLSGTYFYYVWGLGGSAAEAMPDLLRPYAWILKEREELQKALSAVLVVLALIALVAYSRK